MKFRDEAHRELRARRAIVRACRRLFRRGFIGGAEGNVSVRLDHDHLLITPGNSDKASLRASDAVLMHVDGTRCHCVSKGGDSGQSVSSEVGMHLACYREREDIRAVVHAHPPAASGFAVAGVSLPDDVVPELPVIVGPVALVPYARPGTPALDAAMTPFLRGHDAFLLANHGVTTLGRSLKDAMLRMETVEQAARILVVSRLLGGAKPLPDGEAVALLLWRGGSGR